MKTKKLIRISAIVLFICFCISTLLSIRSVANLLKENSKENAMFFVGEVCSAIEDVFSESKAVSTAMNNTITRAALASVPEMTEKESSELFGKYLFGIKRQFGYDTAFLVPQSDLSYYTEWGRNKYLDIDNPDDDWFEHFRATGQSFELNVDKDRANGNRITIYINCRMEDEKGNFIGICGVGLKMDEIKGLIKRLEREHNLSIQLISTDGIIQVSGDDSQQGLTADSDILDMIGKYKQKSGMYLYEGNASGEYEVMGYVDDCRWYIHIESSGLGLSQYYEVIRDNVIAFGIILVVLAVALFVLNRMNRRNEVLKTAAEVDRLTGVGNRQAYENCTEPFRCSGNIRNITVFVIDINSLKYINDNYGHSAGDEAIKKTACVLRSFFNHSGEVFRTGGDEFAVIMKVKEDKPAELATKLKNEVEKSEPVSGVKLSVSVGGACGDWEDCEGIDDLVKIADRRMYADKERYYSQNRKHF